MTYYFLSVKRARPSMCASGNSSNTHILESGSNRTPQQYYAPILVLVRTTLQNAKAARGSPLPRKRPDTRQTTAAAARTPTDAACIHPHPLLSSHPCGFGPAAQARSLTTRSHSRNAVREPHAHLAADT